jgi:S-formylglutathione hydrolase FrmB
VRPSNDKYEDYLVHDLMTDVESRFPAASDRNHRAVVGVSMGGFAAIRMAFTRPDLFAFAGALSPAIDVPSRPFRWRHWQQSLHFRSLFGTEGSTSRQHSDPFLLVQSADPTPAPYLYITAGQQEALLDPNRRFAARLHTLHFSYEFHTSPGGHDWGQWNSQLPACMDSLLQHLQLNPQ